jgi:hypothetical protein
MEMDFCVVFCAVGEAKLFKSPALRLKVEVKCVLRIHKL